MIVIGYQGIGKSTISKNRDNMIDLESSNFYVAGRRANNWYVSYCNIAMNLSDQMNTVFVSSHAIVREYLARHKKRHLIAVCYPVLELEEKWCAKLYDRYRRTQSEKDYRAWMNASDRYEDNIWELMESPFEHIEIESMDYDLEKLIERYET